jgi:hypothetical protein
MRIEEYASNNCSCSQDLIDLVSDEGSLGYNQVDRQMNREAGLVVDISAQKSS